MVKNKCDQFPIFWHTWILLVLMWLIWENQNLYLELNTTSLDPYYENIRPEGLQQPLSKKMKDVG